MIIRSGLRLSGLRVRLRIVQSEFEARASTEKIILTKSKQLKNYKRPISINYWQIADVLTNAMASYFQNIDMANDKSSYKKYLSWTSSNLQ